jgi:hypothetical protein
VIGAFSCRSTLACLSPRGLHRAKGRNQLGAVASGAMIDAKQLWVAVVVMMVGHLFSPSHHTHIMRHSERKGKFYFHFYSSIISMS